MLLGDGAVAFSAAAPDTGSRKDAKLKGGKSFAFFTPLREVVEARAGAKRRRRKEREKERKKAVTGHAHSKVGYGRDGRAAG